MNSDPYHGLSLDQLKAIKNNVLNFRKSISLAERKLLDELSPYTMIPPARLLDAYRSAHQAAKRSPEASIVEFGVFAGGAVASLALGASLAVFDGTVIGFDTFEGHVTRPNSNEIDIHGNPQDEVFDSFATSGLPWAYCDLYAVIENLSKLREKFPNLPQVNLIKGDAVETSKNLPKLCNTISLLRLDMDWYEPTRAALEAAEKLLGKNAIVILDDYGHHSGVKDAADEFLRKTTRPFDLTMVDYSCMRVIFLD
jgi:O-methyltransferase